MRLYASRFAPLLVLLAIGAAEASTCKTLLDSDSTLAKSLSSWTETDLTSIDFKTVFKETDTALPWLSKCAAAIDPKAVYTSLASSSAVKNSISAIENFDKDLSTASGWSSMCTMADGTIKPDVETVMKDIIMDAFDSTGGCCDDFLSEVKTLFGGDALDDMVTKLIELGLNIQCSERTFTNLKGTSTKETCAYSIWNSFSFIETDEDADKLLNLAQIPNDQMCSVFAGKEFTNTNGDTATIDFGTNGVDTMGICLEPIDTMTQYLKSWSIFSETIDADGTSVSLSDLFTSGKSVSATLLLDYAASSSGLPRMSLRATEQVLFALGVATTDDGDSDTFLQDMFVEMLDSIRTYLESVLVHIPNNGGCTFSDQSITLPYSEAAAAVSTGTSAASSVKLSGLVTASAVLVSSVLATLLF
ncbi:hypothetical protein PHYSODRAFT_303572 [Phytophthora sojae]|uniref:Elicitin n=1 Tax=Phytophthora sojae (strain P6497) TaxID=1094619 RepID=G4ZVS8_PHYSP|nr:hypothetical protein PHYSODRAFT_303572 [Phytophthora sojae]EGZ11542.1 hypothetical protein PHYSODRAFT_303572 [Phytophthora sojae]|eukprot:XP_009531875.1 hypothetical protein PHYSODRAFT_303572 [Phytophthora sojae]